MGQAIPGVVPDTEREVTIMTVWPSLGATAYGRSRGRLFGNKLGISLFGIPITVGRILALLSIPFILPVYFHMLVPRLPGVVFGWPNPACRRYRLANRRHESATVRRGRAAERLARPVRFGDGRSPAQQVVSGGRLGVPQRADRNLPGSTAVGPRSPLLRNLYQGPPQGIRRRSAGTAAGYTQRWREAFSTSDVRHDRCSSRCIRTGQPTDLTVLVGNLCRSGNLLLHRSPPRLS